MIPSCLYPEIEPYDRGFLAVDIPHHLYYEQCGNPGGQPILFLHGGPGLGCAPKHRRYFDPDHYRIILIDQRGAGRSTPHGEVAANTPNNLIEDLEALRRHLSIPAWIIFGGSWGSALGLLYGQAYPRACQGFILRSIFLARQEELDWLITGPRYFYPEAWREMIEYLPPNDRHDVYGAYYRAIHGEDTARQREAAAQWLRYEGAILGVYPSAQDTATALPDAITLAMARIASHYFAHRLFITDNQIINNIKRLHHLPAIILHGRMDMMLPPLSAYDLAAAWPGAHLNILPEAGHSASHPNMTAALIEATESLKTIN